MDGIHSSHTFSQSIDLIYAWVGQMLSAMQSSSKSRSMILLFTLQLHCHFSSLFHLLDNNSKIQLVSLCIQRIMRLLIIKTMWMQNCVSVIDLKWTNEWMNDWINHIITFIICTMGARNETIPFVLVSHDKSFHKYQNTLFRKISTTVNLINCGSKTWV